MKQAAVKAAKAKAVTLGALPAEDCLYKASLKGRHYKNRQQGAEQPSPRPAAGSQAHQHPRFDLTGRHGRDGQAEYGR
jgi:hypothetical protein